METINIAIIIGVVVIFALIILVVIYARKIHKLRKSRKIAKKHKREHELNKAPDDENAPTPYGSIFMKERTEGVKLQKPKRKQKKSLISRLHRRTPSYSNIWK